MSLTIYISINYINLFTFLPYLYISLNRYKKPILILSKQSKQIISLYLYNLLIYNILLTIYIYTTIYFNKRNVYYFTTKCLPF